MYTCIHDNTTEFIVLDYLSDNGRYYNVAYYPSGYMASPYPHASYRDLDLFNQGASFVKQYRPYVNVPVAKFNEAYIEWQNHQLESMTGILFLPDELDQIGEEAFCGGTFDAVIIPDTCTSIGSRAFADCPNLRFVQLPRDLTYPADAFDTESDIRIVRR